MGKVLAEHLGSNTEPFFAREEIPVNENSPKTFQINLSNLSFWLAIAGIVWLLGAVGLGWLVNGVLILFGVMILIPILGFFGFRWWLKRNIVEDKCPMCDYEFKALNHTEAECPSCKEPLKINNGRFQRLTPPGTIDVEAVEVTAHTLED